MRCRALLALGMLLAWPGSGFADPFADFRIPDHSWRTGSVDGSVYGHQSASNGWVGDRHGSSLYSRLAGGATFTRDSDALQHSLGLDLDVGNSVDRNKEDWVDSYERRHRDGQQQAYFQNWRLQGGVRTYPWRMPLGLGAGASASGQYRQGWSGSDERNESPSVPGSRHEVRSRVDQRLYAYDVSLRTVAGFGRVRDATVVFDVHLLEERLQATGALARPLSSAARERLAALLFVRPDYSWAHERPERFFWRDVEQLLSADSCLTSGRLDAFSLMRVNEGYRPTLGADFIRLRGFFAGPVASAAHSHVIRHNDRYQEDRYFEPGMPPSVTSSSRTNDLESELDRFQLGGRLEYHRPLGWRWQVDLATEALLPMRADEHGFSVASGGDVTWLIADRWKWSVDLSHSRAVFEPRHSDRLQYDDWSVTWSSVLGFYIEDRTDLYVELRQNQARQVWQSMDSTRYGRDTSFSLGLRYRFMGGYDGPRLIQAEEMPPSAAVIPLTTVP